MLKVETNILHKYLCGLKFGIIIVMVFTFFGESLVSLMILLFVGLGVVFLDDRKIYMLDNKNFYVYKISSKLEGEKLITFINRSRISKIILKFPAVHCMSKIILEYDNQTTLSISGMDLKKDDFSQILNILKKDTTFEVQVLWSFPNGKTQ